MLFSLIEIKEREKKTKIMQVSPIDKHYGGTLVFVNNWKRLHNAMEIFYTKFSGNVSSLAV